MQILVLTTDINNNYLLKKNNDSSNFCATNLLDINCYFIIKCLNNHKLQLSYYIHINSSIKHEITGNHFIPIVFIANNAKSICKLIKYHKKIFFNISSDHALYLGRELMKAEFTLIMNQQYVQN
uniref:DUF4346 domain-containing protein n=1 Tax=Batrachospermum sp. TaxID=31373 RepID=A0A8K1YUT5_9FLOR|nr:hypothetical protein [Batrachospermum sp.]